MANKTFYTSGIRIFSVDQVQSQPSLGDVNNDGVIDIMDAGDVNAFSLQDFNQDGTIDILDTAIYNSDPGGIIIPVPPPTIEPIPLCPGIQIPTPQIIGPGIITTGCTSMPDPPPLPPQPSTKCFPPKVIGFGIDYETGSLRYEGCVCPDASVNVADVLLTIGAGVYSAWRKATVTTLKTALAEKERLLETSYDSLEIANGRIYRFEAVKKQTNYAIDYFRKKIASGDNNTYIDPITGKEKAKDLCFRDGTCIKGRSYSDEIEYRQWQTEKQINGDPSSADSIDYGLAWWEDKAKGLVTTIDRYQDEIKKLKESLDIISNAIDPTSLVTAYLAQLIPINFVVPKVCGWPKVLNNMCECVDPGSGSGSETE